MVKVKKKYLSISFFPNSELWHKNAYYPMLQKALKTSGCDIVDPGSDYLDFNYLLDNRKKIDILHFHWIQYHYKKSNRGSYFSLAKFIIKLILARTLGYKLIWTFHNTMPHEKLPGKIDFIARIVITHLSNKIIVHCKKAKEILKRKFYRDSNVFYIPHGYYLTREISEQDKNIARLSLGISNEQLVFSHIGNIRPYKNIDQLIKQFLRVANPEWKLFITGKALSNNIQEELISLSNNDPRIILNFKYISDQEMKNLLDATDISIFAFKNILCSGSVIESMSSGLPIIAPDIGCLNEWITDERGILFEPDNIDSLGDAMESIVKMDYKHLGKNAKHFVRTWGWDDIGKSTRSVYLS